jgi:hypothetical protein
MLSTFKPSGMPGSEPSLYGAAAPSWLQRQAELELGGRRCGQDEAALSARQDKNLVIAGRTSALAIANLDEAVKRAQAYEAAGVDAIFLAGGVTVAAVQMVSSAIKIPLILGGVVEVIALPFSEALKNNARGSGSTRNMSSKGRTAGRLSSISSPGAASS